MNTNVRDELVAQACARFEQCAVAELPFDECISAVIDIVLAARLPSAVPALDVDELAKFIRSVDGNNSMGAGALAERIVERFSARLSGERASPSFASVPSSAEAVAWRPIETAPMNAALELQTHGGHTAGPFVRLNTYDFACAGKSEVYSFSCFTGWRLLAAAPPSPLADPRVQELVDALQKLIDAADDSDTFGTSTIGSRYVRDIACAALRALSGENGGQS